MELDIEGKSLCIFGLPGAGKSTLRDYILCQYGERAVLYDTLHETPADSPYYTYRPRDRYSIEELEKVVKHVIQERYKLICIEEANRFCPVNQPLPASVKDLNDMRRKDAGHYGIGIIYLARRLVQLHTDLREMADYLAIFRLTGKNDLKYLDDTVQGLADAVNQLPPHHFILVDRDRSFRMMDPIQPSDRWLKK